MNRTHSPLRRRQRASFARPDIYSISKPYAVSDSYSTKLFLPDGKFFGEVIGDTLIKKIKGSRHMLQTPLAIAFDIAAFELARKLGARKVSVTDTTSGKVYKTLFSTIDREGFDVKDYGFGNQRDLRMQYWSYGDEQYGRQLEFWNDTTKTPENKSDTENQGNSVSEDQWIPMTNHTATRV